MGINGNMSPKCAPREAREKIFNVCVSILIHGFIFSNNNNYIKKKEYNRLLLIDIGGHISLCRKKKRKGKGQNKEYKLFVW